MYVSVLCMFPNVKLLTRVLKHNHNITLDSIRLKMSCKKDYKLRLFHQTGPLHKGCYAERKPAQTERANYVRLLGMAYAAMGLFKTVIPRTHAKARPMRSASTLCA